jgi:integrase
MTFEQAARRVHEEQEPGWANKTHAAQWLNTLRNHVFPQIGNHKVARLTPADFAEALRPIWLTTPVTAARIKQRCHKVMKWSWAHGLVSSNPVDNVEHLLPHRNGAQVTHHPAMPWQDIPEFVRSQLRSGPYNVSRALLEFLILTAARSGEARAVTWAEVDFEARVSIIVSGLGVGERLPSRSRRARVGAHGQEPSGGRLPSHRLVGAAAGHDGGVERAR